VILDANVARVGDAKRGGATAEEVPARFAEGLLSDFADLQPASGPAAATGRINAAIQAAYREAR
jgi:hypothetical protein